MIVLKENIYDVEHLATKFLPNYEQVLGKKSVLQCGARPGDGWKKVFEAFQRNGYDTFHLLEIHEPNFKWLKAQNIFTVPTIVNGDIRKIDEYVELNPTYDVVIFWHGIEHLEKKQLYDALKKIMSKTDVFITGCPWGTWHQDDIKNNVHEKHLSHWYPEELEQFGFHVCYTFNNSSQGAGPDKHNVMYAALFKEGWENCQAHNITPSFK